MKIKTWWTAWNYCNRRHFWLEWRNELNFHDFCLTELLQLQRWFGFHTVADTCCSRLLNHLWLTRRVTKDLLMLKQTTVCQPGVVFLFLLSPLVWARKHALKKPSKFSVSVTLTHTKSQIFQFVCFEWIVWVLTEYIKSFSCVLM